MDAKTIQKYSKKTVPQLLKIATIHFNKFIRNRDKELGCVSCDSGRTEEACHLYSAGHYPSLRYNEINVHGGCKHCNRFLSGNLNEYRKRVVSRIGENGLIELDEVAAYFKKNAFKWNRFNIIETIEKYKQLNKQL